MSKILYFFSEDCRPCKDGLPKLERAIKKQRRSIQFEKIDISDRRNLSMVKKYGVDGTPTVVVQNGSERRTLLGIPDDISAVLTEELDKEVLPEEGEPVESNSAGILIGGLLLFTLLIAFQNE